MNVNTVVIRATSRVQRLVRAFYGNRAVSVAPAAVQRRKAATIAPQRISEAGQQAVWEAP